MAAPLVLDNSVVLAWCFGDEATDDTRAALRAAAAGRAGAPAIWPLEAANALLAAERRKRLSLADAVGFIDMLRQLPIAVDAANPGRVWRETLALAREAGLSVYDASYLELAMRHGAALATLDKALRRAAERSGVPLFRAGMV